ncbi:MAG: hypothetical protein ACR2IJ_05630 [Fluviibacter sp.]
MALITIGGQVNSIGWEGKRISVWENIHSNGKDYSRLWTAWFSESQAAQLQEEDFAEITGELSTKIGEYTNKAGEQKVVVEHHLQNAVIKKVVSKTQQQANADAFEEMPF